MSEPPTEVSGPCTQDAWWLAMQGVRTVYSTTWEEKTRKATNPVSQIHSTPFGRHRQHDWPGQAVWIGTGSLWLEEARSRLLCSRPMMMMMIEVLSWKSRATLEQKEQVCRFISKRQIVVYLSVSSNDLPSLSESANHATEQKDSHPLRMIIGQKNRSNIM